MPEQTLEQLVNDKNTYGAAIRTIYHASNEETIKDIFKRKDAELNAKLYSCRVHELDPDLFISGPETLEYEMFKDGYKAREVAVIEKSKTEIETTLSKINEKTLLQYALSNNKTYRDLISTAEDPNRKLELVLSNVKNKDAYKRVLAMGLDIDKIIESNYQRILPQKLAEIQNKEGFVAEEDGKPKINKANIEKYIINEISKLDDNQKNNAYLNLADIAYSRN